MTQLGKKVINKKKMKIYFIKFEKFYVVICFMLLVEHFLFPQVPRLIYCTIIKNDSL